MISYFMLVRAPEESGEEGRENTARSILIHHLGYSSMNPEIGLTHGGGSDLK